MAQPNSNATMNATMTEIDLELEADLAAGVVNIWHLNSKALFYLKELMPIVLIISAGAVAFYMLSYMYNYFYHKIQERIWSSITVKYSDDTFVWLQKYMQDKGIIKDDTQLKAGIKKKAHEDWWVSIKTDMFKNKDDKEKPDIDYLPDAGVHTTYFKGKKLWIVHELGELLMVGNEKIPEEQETLKIICFGFNTDTIKEFIDEAVVHCMQKETNLISIYELHHWGIGFHKVATKRPRSIESVVLDKDMSEYIVDDVRFFQNNAEWYLEKGVPYRRGYLLYGPPGTGKTSFINAIAGELSLNICYLNIGNDSIDDDGLMRALNDAPPRSIILLEDVDGIFIQRESVNQDEKRGVSFSGLLNALDGVRSQEGRILFMTTNHRERLDWALIRPGRCDIQVELKNASYGMVERLFLRFYPGKDEDAKTFAKLIPEDKISMAKLQGHFLKYRESTALAIQKHQELFSDDQTVDEMTVVEWLDRLNLSHYVHQFVRQTCFFVSEIKYHVHHGQFTDKFKFYNNIEKSRLNRMVKGDANALADFQYLNRHGAKNILAQDIQDFDICDEVVQLFPSADEKHLTSITGFQLKDIISESYSLNDLKEGIKKRLEINNNPDVYQRDPRIIADQALDKNFDEETEEEKLKRWGNPKVTLNEILAEFDLVEKCKEKIKEHDITDDILWWSDANELVGLLELEGFTHQRKVPERIKEIKAQHLKDMEKADDEAKKMTVEQKEKINATFGRVRSGAKGAGIITLDADFYLDEVGGGDGGGGCGQEEE